MQLANNCQVEDFFVTGTTTSFAGKNLEYKFFVKSEEDLNKLIFNSNSIKAKIEGIKSKLKFEKIICRFYFGDYIPKLHLQKKLIDIQANIFDEITVQMIGARFDDFKELMTYTTSNFKKPISTLVDLKISTALLDQVLSYLMKQKPSNTKWRYRKLSSYIDRYWLLKKWLYESGIDYVLVGSLKRFGGDTEFRNIDISSIAKIHFGFSGSGLDYRPAPIRKDGEKRGFAPSMDKFQSVDYTWKRVQNENYRKNRLSDFAALNTIESTSYITPGSKMFRLRDYLNALKTT